MNSAQTWLIKHSVDVNIYIEHLFLSKFIGYEDKEYVWRDLLNNAKEGKSIIKDFRRSNQEKKHEIDNFILNNEVSIIGILASQRQGKDCLATDHLDRIKKIAGDRIRIVTLGNFKKPPFVDEKDMYYSLTKCPVGTKKQRVIIYCSELDLFFPARDFKGGENTALNMQINTLAQNKQSIIGCCKLSANVDVSFWRACTMLLFKYISESNLKHDRVEFLSDLGMRLRPQDPKDKTQVMAMYNDRLVKYSHKPPEWYNDEYSEQYHNISEDKLTEYAETLIESGMMPQQVRKMFSQTYRFNKDLIFYQNIQKSLSL